MTKFKTVYGFNVISEIKAGKKIYVIDKCNVNRSDGIQRASEISVGELIECLDNCDTEGRYSFYEIVEEKNEQ